MSLLKWSTLHLHPFLLTLAGICGSLQLLQAVPTNSQVRQNQKNPTNLAPLILSRGLQLYTTLQMGGRLFHFIQFINENWASMVLRIFVTREKGAENITEPSYHFEDGFSWLGFPKLWQSWLGRWPVRVAVLLRDRARSFFILFLLSVSLARVLHCGL